MDLWLIVPAKPFDQGKSRLADTLLPSERAAVNQKLLTQVLKTTASANVFTGVIVISRSEQVLQHARALGAIAIEENPNAVTSSLGDKVGSPTLAASSTDTTTMPTSAQPVPNSDAPPPCCATHFFTHNSTEQSRQTQPSANGAGSVAALPKEYRLNNALGQARQEAIARGADAILVLPIDLPLLNIDDVNQLYKLGAEQHGVVIARSHDNGTNALLLRPPNVIDFAFGIDSFQHHCESASLAGYSCQQLKSTTLAFDLDGPEDWKQYQKLVQDHLRQ